MARIGGYSLPLVAQRVVVRTLRHVVRDPIVLLGLACLAAFLVIGIPGTQTPDRPASTVAPEDAEDRPAGDGQVQVVDDALGAKVAREMAGLDRVVVHGWLPAGDG